MNRIVVEGAGDHAWGLATEVTLCSVPAGHEYEPHFTVLVEYTEDELWKVSNRSRLLRVNNTWTFNADSVGRWPYSEAFTRAEKALAGLTFFGMPVGDVLADWQKWHDEREAARKEHARANRG